MGDKSNPSCNNFEGVTRRISNITIDGVVRRALECLRDLEPWVGASCKHDLVKESLDRLKKECSKYTDALISCVEIVDYGLTICADAQTLIFRFQSAHQLDDSLTNFVAGMREMANAACKAAEDARDRFICVRDDLIKVQQSMEVNLGEVKAEGDRAKTSRERKEKKRKNVSQVIDVSRYILLPMKLPIFDDAFKELKRVATKKTQAKISERQQKQLTCEQGVVVLGAAIGLTEKLIEDIKMICEWWNDISASLSTVCVSTGVLRFNDTMRVSDMLRIWKECEADYKVARMDLACLRIANDRQADKFSRR